MNCGLYRGETDAGALASELRRIQELTRARRHTEALAAARALLRRAPSQRGALYLSALNQRLLDQAKDALETLDALERAHPDYSLLFQERGHCHVTLGDPARAIKSFERAVGLNPALASSWAMLERLLSAAGQPQRAGVASQHLSKLKELPPAIVEAGGWFCDGEHAAAENLLTSYIASQGRHVEALRLLGRIAQRRGATDRAEGLFREVVDSAPGYVAARLDYVRVLIERQKYAAALEQVEQRLRTAPSDPEARFLRATILAGLGRHDAAVPIFRELLSETPQRNHLRIVLGHSLKALGRTDEAVRAYRDATGGQADIGDAYWSLANLKTYRFSDRRDRAHAGPGGATWPGTAGPRAPLLRARKGAGGSGRLWRVLGILRARQFAGAGEERLPSRDDRGQHPPPDRGVQRGILRRPHRCRRSGLATRSSLSGCRARARRCSSRSWPPTRTSMGTQELHDIPRIVSELQGQGSNRGRARYPDLLPGLDPLLFERLGRRYVDETRVFRRGRPRFVDKMPNNFWHVGLIHLMLPNARIIDIRREPMACCVSNLKQLFARGQEFCYGMEDIARYYRTYLELMRHWNWVLPGRVLRVSYEDLVEDLGASVRRILAHCGLEFDPVCLEFHSNRRAINTPSSEQVRQPLFRAGLSQWRHYDPWLDPLREMLGDAIGQHRD